MNNVMKQDTEFFESTTPGEILQQISASGSTVGSSSNLYFSLLHVSFMGPTWVRLVLRVPKLEKCKWVLRWWLHLLGVPFRLPTFTRTHLLFFASATLFLPPPSLPSAPFSYHPPPSLLRVVSGLIPTFIRSLVSTGVTVTILSRYDFRLVSPPRSPAKTFRRSQSLSVSRSWLRGGFGWGKTC